MIFITLILILGCLCWGRLSIQFLENVATSPYTIPRALELPVGFSLVTFCWGWLLAAHLAYAPILVLWLVLGISVDCLKNRRAILLRQKPVQSAVLLSLAAFVVVAISTGKIGLSVFNYIDDWPSYVYLAHRLNVTGTLIDPFNNRRLVSFGASTAFQSLYLKYSGTQSLWGFDYLFGSIAMLLVLRGRLRLTTSALIFSAVLSVLSLVGTAAGPETNLSPRLVIAVLTFSVFYLLQDSFTTVTRLTPHTVVASSLMTSAIFALRPESALPCAIALLALILRTHYSITREVLLAITVGIVGLSGWSMALYESSKTILFPIFQGTGNGKWGLDQSHWGLLHYLRIAWEVLCWNDGFDVLFLALIIALSMSALRGTGIKSSQAQLIAVMSVVLCVPVFVLLMKGLDPWMISRYLAPTTLGLGIYVITNVASPILVRRARPERGAGSSRVDMLTDWTWKNLHVFLALPLILVLFMGYQSLTEQVVNKPLLSVDFRTTGSTFISYFFNGISPRKIQLNFSDPERAIMSTLRVVNSQIPQGSNVLSAIETPNLLDLNKFKVETLDWPTSQNVKLMAPFNQTPKTVLSSLQRDGINFVLAQSPNFIFPLERTIGLNFYSPTWASIAATSRIENSRAIGSSVLSWDNELKKILSDRQVKFRFIGPLVLIDTNTTHAHSKTENYQPDVISNWLSGA